MAEKTKKKPKASTIKSRIGNQIRGESPIGPDLDLKNKILASLEDEEQNGVLDDSDDPGFFERFAIGRETMREQFDPAIARLGEKAVSPFRSLGAAIFKGSRAAIRKVGSAARATRGAIGRTLGLPQTREQFKEALRIGGRRGLLGLQAGLNLPEGAEPGLLSAAVGGLQGLGADIESERQKDIASAKTKREDAALKIKEFKILSDFRVVPQGTPGAQALTLPTSGKEVFVLPKIGALENLLFKTNKEATRAREVQIKSMKEDIEKEEKRLFGESKKVGTKFKRVGGELGRIGRGSPEAKRLLEGLRSMMLSRAVIDDTFSFDRVPSVRQDSAGLFSLFGVKGEFRLTPGDRSTLGLSTEEFRTMQTLKRIPLKDRTKEQQDFIDAMFDKFKVFSQGLDGGETQQ